VSYGSVPYYAPYAYPYAYAPPAYYAPYVYPYAAYVRPGFGFTIGFGLW